MHIERIKKISRGFSLIEIIISIGIISVGIVSIMSLFSHITKSETRNKNELIATYLAEEGLEAVRQKRDNYWLAATPSDWWTEGIGSAEKMVGFKTCSGSGCTIKDGFIITDNPSENDKKVYIDETNNYYGQYNGSPLPTTWRETGFKRWLTVEAVDYNGSAVTDYLKVTSHVSYNGGKVELVAYFNNWFTPS